MVFICVADAETEIQEIRRLAALNLSRYRTHEDYDDLLQEAWLRSWQQWQRCRGKWALTTIVRIATKAAAIDWNRSAKARQRVSRSASFSVPLLVSLDEIDPSALPMGPDPTNALVERIGTEEMVERALSMMTKIEADYVRGTILADCALSEFARAHDRTRPSVAAGLRRGLKRARAGLGKEEYR